MAACWVLAAVGLSPAWLLLLGAVMGTIWKSNISQLIEDAVRHEMLRVRQRRALIRDESAEWLNFLINRWWVFSSRSLFTLMKEHLEPLLTEAKPSVVDRMELLNFTLGEQTPRINAVRVFDISQGQRVPLSVHSLRPPSGLALNVRHQLALEADVGLDSDDFQLVLRARLFGKGVGMDLDLAMEKLNFSGQINLTFSLDMEAPFPHITQVSLTFMEKPEIWFSIRALKSVQVMELPLLKSWLHSLLMDALVTALVDPGKVDINLAAVDRPAAACDSGDSDPQGVLTATLSAAQPATYAEDARWLVMALGSQRCRTSPLRLQNWQESVTFLVNSLQSDRLVIKMKSKRLVSTVTLSQYELPLASLALEEGTRDTTLHGKGGSAPALSLHILYTPLPPVQLDQLELESKATGLAGVLCIQVHYAEGLVSTEHTECNPYCIVFHNRTKVKTTHFIRATASPQWESRTHILVSDYTQSSLSFVVCSWSPRKMTDSELLGLAHLHMSKNEPRVIRRHLVLNGAVGGSITVSVMFRAVPSVTTSYIKDSSSVSGGTWMQQARMLLAPREPDISSLLAHGLGLMEVSLLRARDLEAKDLNGFSDPYCELKVGGECKYKSSVKKKTLCPEWEENALVALPRTCETLDVVLWDHDSFGMKDFLGSVNFTLEDIRRFSKLDSVQCCQLQGVKTGTLELKIKVISEEAESQEYLSTNTSNENSPRLSVWNEFGNSSRRMSGEKVKTLRGTQASSRPFALGCKSAPPNQTTADTGALEKHNGHHSEIGFPRNGNSGNTLQEVSHVTELPDIAGSKSAVTPSPSPSPDSQLKKTVPEYSSFRVMKQKVKEGLKLRRFRSEASVHDKPSRAAAKSSSTIMSLEPSGGGESDATELLMDGLAHAVSQPIILQSSPALSRSHIRHRRPMDLKVPAPLRPDRYFGVEGKVIQAQGLHVAQIAQLYCRVKLHSASSPDKLARIGSYAGGRTVAKSRLLPAVPNPQFDLSFQLNNPDTVPRHAALLFEIRSSGKEVVGSRRVTLQDLLSAASSDTNVVHTWLALSNGASLEVEIAHSRELKKTVRRIFRSWSVHRIGKI
ncbi:uncharacterized protein [Anabrus simplex]|uniref:uncharacterized protein n=1 Tax=Anabrus simplex TaxID=316456 RepID=UPI0035A34DD1